MRPTRSTLGDVALAVALAAGGIATSLAWNSEAIAGPERSLDATGIALIIATAAATIGRRRWPVPTLAAATVFTSAYLVVGYPYGLILLSFALTVFTVARRVPLPMAALSALAALLVLTAHLFTNDAGAGGIRRGDTRLRLGRRAVRARGHRPGHPGGARARAGRPASASTSTTSGCASPRRCTTWWGTGSRRSRCRPTSPCTCCRRSRSRPRRPSTRSAGPVPRRSTNSGRRWRRPAGRHGVPAGAGPRPRPARDLRQRHDRRRASTSTSRWRERRGRCRPPSTSPAYRVVQESLTNVLRHGACEGCHRTGRLRRLAR